MMLTRFAWLYIGGWYKLVDSDEYGLEMIPERIPYSFLFPRELLNCP